MKYQLRLKLILEEDIFIHLLSGPITIAEYMREVLTNPIHGFYMDKNVLGSEGHFITSPEIRLPCSVLAQVNDVYLVKCSERLLLSGLSMSG